MGRLVFFVAVLALYFDWCAGDVYMHNPRGTNNRINEKTATRTNNNRIFDSQTYFQSGKYLAHTAPAARSELVISWTNQHGCGGNEDTDPHKQNCNVVLQYMCQPHSEDDEDIAPDDGITLRDGSSTGSQNYNKIDGESAKSTFESQKKGQVAADKGLNEPYYWYDDCRRRQRNKGLFTATQNLARDDASSTRQNPNGDRSGYECPEERDYYPYWHPSPFTDIAVLAQNESLCEYYTSESANRVARHRCIEKFAGSNDMKHFSEHNNREDCESNGGAWTALYSMLELAPQYTTQSQCESDHDDEMSYKWGTPYDPAKFDTFTPITDVCFVQPPPVDCRAAPWSRSNHLGNGREGVPLNYTWTLPYFPSGNNKRCILRIRYNISTDDYDPYNTDASHNGDQSPIKQNPLVDVGANAQALRLAINTAQTGRTFQDRSHVFILKPRPDTFAHDARVINLNVQGKRGNIVQTFPAVEYDFFPNRLEISQADLIHIQWTGSNTHDNNAPGGDGQTGDAGEGTGGTDRHNILQTKASDVNYPMPHEVLWSGHGEVTTTKENIELILATSGYYECFTGCEKSVEETNTVLNSQLNNAPASFRGVVLRFTASGKYYFICTRNNSFTNRSQKGHIFITD